MGIAIPKIIVKIKNPIKLLQKIKILFIPCTFSFYEYERILKDVKIRKQQKTGINLSCNNLALRD